jgi:serine protease
MNMRSVARWFRAGALPIVLAAAALSPAAASAADVVRVQFTAASDARLAGARFAGAEAVNAALDRHDAGHVRRAFVRGEADLAGDRSALERRSGRRLADLNAYFSITTASGDGSALAKRLAALPGVARAYVAPAPVPPPVTPDFSAAQGYRGATPDGIGLTGSAGVPGVAGDRVRVLDVEYSWNRQHEDLGALTATGVLVPNGTPSDPFADTNHGTATLGELVASTNGFGVTGLVPGATPRLVNAYNPERGWDLANAITLARQQLRPGDVMMIEQQVSSSAGQYAYVPVEQLPEVYDAITYATAAGINVVEAAGNGGVDLDALAPGKAFPDGRADSGAIVVGAGAAPGCGSPARSRLSFSTYGSRVDLQGWGQCVTTTGYGALSALDPDALYTSSFNGTSSATPIVAAAAAAVSSAYIARTGHAATPAQVRQALRSTGSPQDTTSAGVDAGHIGPLPDVGKALAAIGALPPAGDPTNLVRNPSFEADTAGWGSTGTLSRVAVAGAPDGGAVAKLAWRSGTAIALDDALGSGTPSVASTAAGTTYVATASVAAAVGASVGKPVQIALRETTPAGALVKDTVVTRTLTSGWTRIGVSATASAAGNRLGLRLVQTGAAAGSAFLADLLTVRKAAALIGATTPGTTWSALDPNVKRASAFTFTAPARADVSGLRAYLDGRGATSGSQKVIGLLYADQGGEPGALVARTNEVTITAGRAAGWVVLNFAAPARVSAGKYWLGLHAAGTSAVARSASTSATGALRRNADAYGDGSTNPFGTATTDAKRLSIYALGG